VREALKRFQFFPGEDIILPDVGSPRHDLVILTFSPDIRPLVGLSEWMLESHSSGGGKEPSGLQTLRMTKRPSFG
jgi:hypothetical protein